MKPFAGTRKSEIPSFPYPPRLSEKGSDLMNITQAVPTRFAQACEQKMLSSIGKGVSKHIARAQNIAAGGERMSSDLLHSDDTINSYANCLTYYARWMDENHTDCNRLQIAHKCHYDREFIQHLIETNAYSPATIKLYTAALAFVHGCTMNQIHDNRPTVRAEDTTRSRSYTEEKYDNQLRYRFKYGPMAVAHIMQICRVTGLRRDEAEQIRPSNFGFDGKVYHCHLSGNPNRMKYPDEKTVWTKGGRERTIDILPKYNTLLREILSSYQPDEKICSEIPDRIGVHGIRSMYACELYQAFARDISAISPTDRTMENGKSRPTRYRDSQGYTWDRDALLRVSASLGHNRSEVVVRHYLWRLRQIKD